MTTQPCLLLRRKDGEPLDLETWRRVATECGAEITDSYQGINPYTQGPMPLAIPGSGCWRREGETLHLRFQGQDVHIRHPCDLHDPRLNRLASLLDAELVPEDSWGMLKEQLRRDREAEEDL